MMEIRVFWMEDGDEQSMGFPVEMFQPCRWEEMPGALVMADAITGKLDYGSVIFAPGSWSRMEVGASED